MKMKEKEEERLDGKEDREGKIKEKEKERVKKKEGIKREGN